MYKEIVTRFLTSNKKYMRVKIDSPNIYNAISGIKNELICLGVKNINVELDDSRYILLYKR